MQKIIGGEAYDWLREQEIATNDFLCMYGIVSCMVTTNDHHRSGDTSVFRTSAILVPPYKPCALKGGAVYTYEI